MTEIDSVATSLALLLSVPSKFHKWIMFAARGAMKDKIKFRIVQDKQNYSLEIAEERRYPRKESWQSMASLQDSAG